MSFFHRNDTLLHVCCYIIISNTYAGSRRNSKEVVPNPQLTLDVDEEKEKDDRGFNEAVIVGTHPLSAGEELVYTHTHVHTHTHTHTHSHAHTHIHTHTHRS